VQPLALDVLGQVAIDNVWKQIGWYLDCRTAARIRISGIWMKHPKFTAKQVIEKLGPGPFMRLKWVRQIMKECRRPSAKHSPEAVADWTASQPPHIEMFSYVADYCQFDLT
jgi:hypothetical protein